MRRSVRVGAALVDYERDGTGPGLVLVHGTGGDARSHWDLVVPGLGPDRTVVRPTLSGSPGTTDDGGPLTLDLLAAQVIAVADDAGLAGFDLVGYSLGAAVALRVASTAPGRVRRLVLVAGFASGDDPRLQLEFSLWQDLARTDHRAAARLFVLTGFSPTYVAGLTAAQVDEAVDVGVRTNDWPGLVRQVALDAAVDVRADTARIAVPTLCVGCTQDVMVGAARARALADAIPGATYVEVDSGHLVVFEAPDRLAEVAHGFLTADAPGMVAKTDIPGGITTI